MIRGLPLATGPIQTPEPLRQRATADFGAAVGLHPTNAVPKAKAIALRDEPAVAESQPPSDVAALSPALGINAARPEQLGVPAPNAAEPRPAVFPEASVVAFTPAAAVVAPAVVQPAASAISASVVVGGVAVETFDLPWTLAANGHLAWQSQGASSSDVVAEMPIASNQQDLGSIRSGVIRLPERAGGMGTSPGHTAVSNALWLARAVAHSQGELHAEETTPVELLSSGAAPADWQQRLLRTIKRFEAVTLFVRDYRLDAAGADALSQRLVQAARDEGRALARVVINGHTTWERQSEENIHAG